jgi:hypothetical protein
MRRGGRRRRYVSREDTAVTCAGRWGPRRLRVTQCWAILSAESLYTGLLRDDWSKARPGACGYFEWTLPGCRSLSINWELRANAVWRFGRLFLRCPRCERLATRIYVPAANLWPACRQCWGLTYESRQRRNYRGNSAYSLAHWLTLSAREDRAAAAAQRYAERRAILKRLPAGA